MIFADIYVNIIQDQLLLLIKCERWTHFPDFPGDFREISPTVCCIYTCWVRIQGPVQHVVGIPTRPVHDKTSLPTHSIDSHTPETSSTDTHSPHSLTHPPTSGYSKIKYCVTRVKYCVIRGTYSRGNWKIIYSVFRILYIKSLLKSYSQCRTSLI